MPDSTIDEGGRPTKYHPDFVHLAYIACKEGGFTDLSLSKLLKVSKTTINNWKKEHPEFYAAVKKGKDEHDCEKVEASFLKRAKGFRYVETTRELQQVLSQPAPVSLQPTDGTDASTHQPEAVATFEMVVTKRVSKVYPPDAKACMDWLCNRNPDRWKKMKHVEVTGKDGENLLGSAPVTAFIMALEQLGGKDYVEMFKDSLRKHEASATKP